MKNTITVFTDGASSGNPGPGGFGAIIVFPEGRVVEIGGANSQTTNNRMEMTAALEALNAISKRNIENKNKIVVYTDSAYLLQGIGGWVYAWQKNNWKTKTGEDVANRDLWEELFKIELGLKFKYDIKWEKVKGHSGIHGNERCDEIATEFSLGKRPLLFTGTLKEYKKLVGGDVLKIKKREKPEKVGKSKKTEKPKGQVYSYVSMVGGMIETHKTWPDCEARVKGKSGARFQKSMSSDEESEIIARFTLEGLNQNFNAESNSLFD